MARINKGMIALDLILMTIFQWSARHSFPGTILILWGGGGVAELLLYPTSQSSGSIMYTGNISGLLRIDLYC